MNIEIQNAIKKFQDFYRKNQRPPTYEEIAVMFTFASTNASYKLVKKLIGIGVLDKDESGKIIPKNLFKIPTTEQQQEGSVIDTNYLQIVVDELLAATRPLAEAHPLPKSEDDFLRVIEATYRRDTYTLLAISYLSRHVSLADSAMDLVRKMIEDTVSIEYMIANGKGEMAKRFKRFMWVQLHRDMEFLKITGGDFKLLELEERLSEIEKKYKEVRSEFIHKSGDDLHSWIGKDVETMLKELKTKNALSEHDISRTAIGYVKGCWKNHFNPYDVNAYLTSDLLEASSHDAMNQALIFGVTCLYRLTTRYIDHIRHLAQKNEFDDVAQKIRFVWKKLNPE